MQPLKKTSEFARMSETTERMKQRSARTGPMAKRRTKRKKHSRGGGILALLLVLCIGGAILWRYCELPVPAVLTERTEVAGDLAAEKLTEVRSRLSDWLADLMAKMPPELREQLSVQEEHQEEQNVITLDTLPDYDGSPYVELYGGQPAFTEEQKAGTESYETYAPLDLLGRCGTAKACIGQDLMPTEERGAIGMVKPSGWHTVRYDGLVDGKYLYNRCHLIGYQLAGENANERNLITGTRYLNVEGMLPFENRVADYVRETGNHVLYRVTPVFRGMELVARGVQLEAWSVEDGGAGVCFNVYCYNVQPGVEIDYATGESCLAEENIP